MSISPDEPVTSQPISMEAAADNEDDDLREKPGEKTGFNTTSQRSYGADDLVPAPIAAGAGVQASKAD